MTIATYIQDIVQHTRQSMMRLCDEFQYECMPTDIHESAKQAVISVISNMHIPFLPPFHRPGWLLRYVIGPYDKDWINGLTTDFLSGITVGLILIPQGLAYGLLADVPAINGLYAAIIPSCIYVCLGSSMQLGVGPVAIVSLLTSQIVAKYETDGSTEEILNITAEICVCVGLILTVLGLFNMGSIINLISHPVMSGFTTAAAFNIGLSQLPNAIGIQTGSAFQKVPKSGQPGYEYNYQVMAWYVQVWNLKINDDDTPGSHAPAYMIGWSRFNPFSQRIFAGVYVPLMLIQILKLNLVETEERKAAYWYKLFMLITPLLPFLAIIIAAKATMDLMQDPSLIPYSVSSTTYLGYMQNHINIVGAVTTPGTGSLSFVRTPQMIEPFGSILVDSIPLTFVLFMESIAVARRIAAQRNQLHILNASQEMFALGIGNFFGALSSGFPVAGSFSRSSLYNNLGTKSILALLISMFVLLTAIGALADTFYYIPQAALSAIIFVALYSVISITEFWEAWKNNKKDFFVMFMTFFFVFVYNTTIGLPIGLGCSLLVYLYDLKFKKTRGPYINISQYENDGIDIVKVNSELTFLTIDTLKEYINTLTKKEEEPLSESAIWQEKMIQGIAKTLDNAVTLKHIPGVNILPKAVIVDLIGCSFIDLTSIHRLHEISFELKVKGVSFVIINANSDVSSSLKKFGFVNSRSTATCNLDIYLQQATNIDTESVKDIEIMTIKNYDDTSRIDYDDSSSSSNSFFARIMPLSFISRLSMSNKDVKKDVKKDTLNESLTQSSSNPLASSMAHPLDNDQHRVTNSIL